VPGPLVPTIDEFMREAVADLCRAAIGATGPLVDSARRPWSSATHLRPRVELARGEARSRRGAAQAAGYAAWQLVEFGVHDFTTMYTSGAMQFSRG